MRWLIWAPQNNGHNQICAGHFDAGSVGQSVGRFVNGFQSEIVTLSPIQLFNALCIESIE